MTGEAGRVETTPLMSTMQRLGGMSNFGLVAFLVFLCVLFAFLSPVFLSVNNLLNVLLSVSIIGVMAAVSTLVIVSRGLDLSLGSITALASVIVAMAVTDYGLPWWIGACAGLVVGALAGAMNGFIITKMNINSIIVTIGTLSIFRGAAFILTDGQTVIVDSEPLLFIGSGRVAGVPVAIFILAIVFVGCHVIAEKTRIGRTLYAIGSSPRASMLSGLNLDRARLGIFVASGVSAGLAGILLAGQSGAAVPGAAVGYELLAITAVLLGGTSLAGGEGKVSGTLLGVLILGVLNNGMTLLAVDSFYQTAAHGVLLLVAVWLDRMRRAQVIE